jgi:hypothetical protein
MIDVAPGLMLAVLGSVLLALWLVAALDVDLERREAVRPASGASREDRAGSDVYDQADPANSWWPEP